jgi:hypothetical protein
VTSRTVAELCCTPAMSGRNGAPPFGSLRRCCGSSILIRADPLLHASLVPFRGESNLRPSDTDKS